MIFLQCVVLVFAVVLFIVKPLAIQKGKEHPADGVFSMQYLGLPSKTLIEVKRAERYHSCDQGTEDTNRAPFEVKSHQSNRK